MHRLCFSMLPFCGYEVEAMRASPLLVGEIGRKYFLLGGGDEAFGLPLDGDVRYAGWNEQGFALVGKRVVAQVVGEGDLPPDAHQNFEILVVVHGHFTTAVNNYLVHGKVLALCQVHALVGGLVVVDFAMIHGVVNFFACQLGVQFAFLAVAVDAVVVVDAIGVG